jgi:uncharacterized protein (DUF697 family)/tellurite resistance protein
MYFFALKGAECSMLEQTQKSILAIGLFAAFADGAKSTEEREQIRRMAESLADGADLADLARLYQDVLLKRVSLASVCANLDDSGERQLAYEMAVCVCDADGRQSAAEVKFLAELKPLLRLETAQTDAFDKEADAVVELAETAVPVAVVAAASASAPVAAPAAPAAVSAVTASQVPQAELDKSILNHAMLCGALELLPQSWASMAIIPMQIKMVYGIGKAHGVELDQGHIKEFIAAAGVGLGSQYLEQFGRKLLGGSLGKVAGRTIGGIGRAATGVAFSFATTYALGQLAARYYAGGRVMNTALLQKTFSELLGPAKQMQAQYLPQIQAQAANLDAGKIMGMLRKGAV